VTYVLYERRDNPIFCPILNMLALAFADRAFKEEGIWKPEDIDSLVIPDYKERLVLDWRPEVMETPIFRTKGKDWEISASEAWSYADFNYYMKRLGVLAGYPQISRRMRCAEVQQMQWTVSTPIAGLRQFRLLIPNRRRRYRCAAESDHGACKFPSILPPLSKPEY